MKILNTNFSKQYLDAIGPFSYASSHKIFQLYDTLYGYVCVNIYVWVEFACVYVQALIQKNTWRLTTRTLYYTELQEVAGKQW